jgi:hypothetical protein
MCDEPITVTVTISTPEYEDHQIIVGLTPKSAVEAPPEHPHDMEM